MRFAGRGQGLQFATSVPARRQGRLREASAAGQQRISAGRQTNLVLGLDVGAAAQQRRHARNLALGRSDVKRRHLDLREQWKRGAARALDRERGSAVAEFTPRSAATMAGRRHRWQGPHLVAALEVGPGCSERADCGVLSEASGQAQSRLLVLRKQGAANGQSLVAQGDRVGRRSRALLRRAASLASGAKCGHWRGRVALMS